MKKLIFPLLALSLLAVSPAQAALQKYNYDTAHTQVHFKISHLGFSFSHGRFLDFTGYFMFDPEKPETSSAEMVINTASIFMGTEAWDKHLKNADFFNVEKFPTMIFKSSKVERTGDKTANLTGDLTILGVTKPVTLAVTFNGAGEHPMSKKAAAGFTATGTLKRSDFGMTYGIPNVGDDVSLMIEVEGTAEDPAPVNK
jgi:polyisoprenoid-binding protein YceI